MQRDRIQMLVDLETARAFREACAATGTTMQKAVGKEFAALLRGATQRLRRKARRRK